jgi:hypothetical protein
MEPRLRAGKSLIYWHREAWYFAVEWWLQDFHQTSLFDVVIEEDNCYHRWKIFPPKLPKSPYWVDILTRDSLEQDVPRRLALLRLRLALLGLSSVAPDKISDSSMTPAGALRTPLALRGK